mmetsp:Transcript_56310/g.122412  ORF Transcript_56310/g.122412 Transcript_56310/m.122412 type:complete len:93 (-) Transcript_56310:1602-1880(-)
MRRATATSTRTDVVRPSEASNQVDVVSRCKSGCIQFLQEGAKVACMAAECPSRCELESTSGLRDQASAEEFAEGGGDVAGVVDAAVVSPYQR